MRLDNNLIRRPRQPSIRSLPSCFGLIPHSRVTKTHILLVQHHSRIEIFVFIDGSARVELTFDLCAEANGAADLFFFLKKKKILVSWIGVRKRDGEGDLPRLSGEVGGREETSFPLTVTAMLCFLEGGS